MKNIVNHLDLVQINAIVLFSLAIIVLFFILKRTFNKKIDPHLRLVPFYIFLIIFQLAFANYVVLTAKDEKLINLSAYIFIIFEYVIFALLLSKFIRLGIIKKYLTLSCALFVLVGIVGWYQIPLSRNALSFITTVESISLIPFCLYYFYELLNNPPFSRLTGKPSFWITTGILFLLVGITPYYLVFNQFKIVNEMQMIDFFCYDLLVLFLAKASLTKPKSENG